MTFVEFKAWLSGYEEAIGSQPTPEQYAAIRQKLDEVTTFGTKTKIRVEPAFGLGPSFWRTFNG